MPIKKYNKAFGGKKGSASKALAAMKQEYGDKKGESVFYAKVNSMKSKSKSKKNYKQKGGENPMEGNSMPFQLGDEKGRFITDSRKMGAMSFKKG